MTKLLRIKGAQPAVPFIKTIRNKLNRDTGRYGLFNYGNYEYGAENEIGRDMDGVYQMRNCEEGYIPVKMRFQKTREETPTDARVAVWAKFANAVSGWLALTDEQKAVYNERAKGTNKCGMNIYISEYMLS